jgi:spore germination cell wall hydrolase CwlJ-like protein
MPTRLRVLPSCCAIVVLVAFGPERRAIADPDKPGSVAAIANAPLGEEPHPLLTRGDTGDAVQNVQILLNRDRTLHAASHIGEDGVFGEETLLALQTFQRRHGLTQSGKVDMDTWRALEAQLATSAPSNTNSTVPPLETFGPGGMIGGAASVARAATTNTPPTASSTSGIIGFLGEGHNDPVHLSAAALDALARIIESEAGVCSDEGKVAVGAVVLNRVNAGFANGTVQGVIAESGQFTSYGDSAYRGSPSEASRAAAQRAAAGEDPSNGALYYYNPYLVTPYWAKGMTQTARIGRGTVDTHRFMKP